MRERSVFIDTSAFYALLDGRDRWNAEATRQFGAVTDERRPLVTSNLVVAETYTLARRALGHRAALRWLDSLDINLFFETEEHHGEVCRLLARYEDKSFSYTDALSFVLMERLGIPVALTFDADFRRYGLDVLP